MASPAPDSKTKKPLQFGKPEPVERTKTLIKIAIIVIALIAIIWMAMTAAPQKEYNCTPGAHAGLTDIGTCTTE